MKDLDLPANFDARFKTLITSFQTVTYALNNAIKSEYFVSEALSTHSYTSLQDRKRKRDEPAERPRARKNKGSGYKTAMVDAGTRLMDESFHLTSRS